MRNILILVALLSSLASAKVVTDSEKFFCVDVPDAWKHSASKDARGVEVVGWKNSKNTGGLILTRVGAKEKSLEDWARAAARQNPQVTIQDEKLDGQPAKRLEFKTNEGYHNVLWLTKKGQQGAMVTLVYTDECPDDVENIKKSIVSSFHWKK
ncbi:hypothetical protein JST97_23060 [bacterium]|nr:hypothetical protein [bacterium]